MQGFPAWIVVTHFLNILWMVLLARSGIEVLSSCPKLYWGDGCLPGGEWLRFSRREFRADSPQPWSGLDEEESWSPVLALPGRKNLGLGRHWHLLTLQFWILTGAVYVGFLVASGYWSTLVPTHWGVFAQAGRDITSYLHGHLPPLQAGSRFNAVQQLSYFVVVFLLAPLQIATGAAMSPAVAARFPWYPRLFGSRQSARSLHFLGMCAFGVFVVVHTVMVVLHGLAREFAAMMLGSYRANPALALVIGLSGLGAIALFNVAITCLSLRQPGVTHRVLCPAVDPLQRALSVSLASRQRFSRREISPYHRVNGFPPASREYQRLRENNFAEYRLEIGGLVEHPLVLSLPQLRALGWQTQVTRHTCIQGWTAIAEWGGVPLATVLDRAQPMAQARYLVFVAFDEKPEAGGGFSAFYGTVAVELAADSQSLLALEMNGNPLPVAHGAPLRARLETQLGFKMVKWIRRIDLVHDYRHLGRGHGGWREDHQHFTTYPAI